MGIESDGVLVAYASEFAWETDPRFADIGVLAHPDHRRQGYTGSVTRELCRRIFEQDRLPLYRHNLHNVASAGVARSVGFVRVASLTAATIRP